jgi:hypothetical protein
MTSRDLRRVHLRETAAKRRAYIHRKSTGNLESASVRRLRKAREYRLEMAAAVDRFATTGYRLRRATCAKIEKPELPSFENLYKTAVRVYRPAWDTRRI